MFKKYLVILFALLSSVSFGQDMPSSVNDVIDWQFKVNYASCNEATIVITVHQKDGWHIYTQKQPEGAVSFPTEFRFKPSDNYELLGKAKEYGTELHEGQFPEKIFPGDKAIFKQKIKIKSIDNFKLELDYTFMACLEACFPPTDGNTIIDIKGKGSDCDDSGDDQSQGSDSESITTSGERSNIDTTFVLYGLCEGYDYPADSKFKPVKVNLYKSTRNDYTSYSLSLGFEVDSLFGMYAFNNPKGYRSKITYKDSSNFTFDGPAQVTAQKVDLTSDQDTMGYKYIVTYNQKILIKDTNNIQPLDFDLEVYLYGCENSFENSQEISATFDLSEAIDSGTRTDKRSLWLLFIVAFLGGFVALLTPCVFPMIPMTVSFFTKQSKTKSEGIRKAILYSVSIILIYVILGVLVASVFGGDALNAMSTNPYVNIAFFALFVIFAVSFFGAFEITLPESWVNKADKNADKGGLIGIFFMAFTLALVSFSCTGPIVGTVLIQSASGGVIGPVVAMLGFSLALALPFGLFAAFPGWLNSLPSSGGWLNVVKVVLGFIELAFALKFLSNADLVQQWHFLEREVFLALWIGVFVMLFIYLIGKIQMPHDSPVTKLSVGRMLFALVNLCFIIYLIPGLWGAPLKLISGFPPPMTYSESPHGFYGEAPKVDEDAGWPASTHAHGHGIMTIRDYDEALAYAKKINKPLLIDFTGWACVNCRRMEENVWAHESISPIMAEDFIVASLYVDERTPLTDEHKGKPMVTGSTMETVGHRWTNMQIDRYQEVTQPLYVVVDHNENNISGKANYANHGTPEKFKAWLKNAKRKFADSKDYAVIEPEFKVINK